MKKHSLPAVLLTVVSLVVLLSACAPAAKNPALDQTPGLERQIDLTMSGRATAFVPNPGLSGTASLFHGLGAAGTLLFGRDQIVFPLPDRNRADALLEGLLGDPSDAALAAASTALRLRLVGADTRVRVMGRDRLPGIVNYFLGNDPAAWQTDIPTYGSLIYEQLYPGIDLIYDGSEGVLKGTYLVAPGAEPDDIRWRYEGASQVKLDGGELLISTGEDGQGIALVERKPAAWQTVAGEQRAVPVRYTLHRDGAIGFKLGRYDADLPLLIDPTLDYYTYFGASGADGAYDIALDADNNVYITGRTNSPDLPPLDGSAYVGDFDIFVTKLDLSKTGADQLVYTTYIGGTGFDIAHSMAVDAAGNAYVIGYSESDDFPATPASAYQATLGGGMDAVLVQLDTAGAIHYATYLGGAGEDQFIQMALGDDGLAYAVGWSGPCGEFSMLNNGAVFPITADAYQPAWAGGTDGYACGDAVVSVVDTSKSGADSLVYSTYYGGTLHDMGYSIDVANGIIYLAGETQSTDLNLKNPIQDENMGGGYFMELFLAKLDRTKKGAEQLLFATYLGGHENPDPKALVEECSGSLLAEPSGTVYWVGVTGSSDFPTTAGSPAYGGGEADAFLAKVDTTNASLLFSRFFGGSGNEGFRGLAKDQEGNLYVSGGAGSADMPTADPLQATFEDGIAEEGEFKWYGPGDALVAKFDPTGAMTFATWLGGDEADTALGLALGSDGFVYVSGGTGSDGLATANAYQAHNAGWYDAWVARIGGLLPEPQEDQHKVYLPVVMH